MSQYHQYHHALGLKRRLAPNLEYVATNLLKQRWKQKRTSGSLTRLVQTYEEDLLRFPNDLGKLRVVHQLYIELGMHRECLLSIARTDLDDQPEKLGMAAFALQLMGSSQVEDYCALALKRDMKSFWATLALLELYYAQGRFGEGLRVIREFHYESDSFFANCAMYNLLLGRKMLFQFELGKFDSVYVTADRINDTVVRCGASDGYYDNIMCDGEEEMWQSWTKADLAAATWRMRMGGFSLEREMNRFGGTAINPYHLYSDALEKHTAFDAVFACLSKLGSGDSYADIVKGISFLSVDDFTKDDEEEESGVVAVHSDSLLEPLELEFVQVCANDVVDRVERAGRPIVAALAWMAQDLNDPCKAFDELFAVRHLFAQIGGMQSHREVLDETLMFAASRACERNPNKYGLLADALSMERIALRPGSAQTWYWRCTIMRALGRESMAVSAHKRAYELQM